KVILTSRDSEKGNKAIKNINGDVLFHQLDVTDDKSILGIASFLKNNFGKLDILINNAGIGVGSNDAMDTEMSEVKQIMETNLYGAWNLTKMLLPLLKKSDEGRIINMSSGMGALDDLTGGYAGYRLSKSSLNALTILMANELSNTNIKINAMCPGWVRTDMGGANASRSVEKGAETATWLATEKTIPTGKFFRDMKIIKW
ncbi:MAG: SDR family NAD(P)-dependent oxidoreductase, partial [Ignavibacteriales bacterium]|nr:SDR family NAD(P)-dependent oxidoreductase [Ignavibacteriales bacterium]